ncbi:helix-turn-helix domain-containing protein [Nonomuraea dietziae]|uniref:winged helix-turn-helix transcriptional regulator n=1 Tax=Nonomuraea dietziae TaxID=65515 RepID=UPI0031DE72B1
MEDGTIKSLGYCGDTDGDYDVLQWDTRADCEVRQILDRVADKWSLLVIALLDRRSLRFTELRRLIDGVSQRMLTRTLRHLERDGLVSRTVHATVPPRVDYELTPLGATLHATIRELVTWTETHQNEIAAAPHRLRRPRTGRAAGPPRRRRPSGPRSPATSWRPAADASPRTLYAVRGKARR